MRGPLFLRVGGAQLVKVADALARGERVLRTPIPLGYTRYAIRFLWLWLTLLPFALTRTFADFGAASVWWEGKAQPVLVLAMLLIGFIFLSIEDIAVQIEEPFAILPLEQHAAWLERDAEQMKRVLQHHERVLQTARARTASGKAESGARRGPS